jgi:hypothetical protein
MPSSEGPAPTTNTAGAGAHLGYAYATGGFGGIGGCSCYGDGRQASSACSGLRGASVAVISALSGSAAACGQGLALG